MPLNPSHDVAQTLVEDGFTDYSRIICITEAKSRQLNKLLEEEVHKLPKVYKIGNIFLDNCKLNFSNCFYNVNHIFKFFKMEVQFSCL